MFEEYASPCSLTRDNKSRVSGKNLSRSARQIVMIDAGARRARHAPCKGRI